MRKKYPFFQRSMKKIQNYIVRELRRGATIYPAYGGLDHARACRSCNDIRKEMNMENYYLSSTKQMNMHL